MATVKARAKRHTHVKRGWESHVPRFNIMDYRGSMIDVLNYFNSEVDDKIKKNLALKYWKSIKKDVSGLEKLPDFNFSQAGALAYLISNGIELEDRDLARLTSKFDSLKAIAVEPEKPKRVVNIRKNIDSAVDKHVSEIDAAIDDFVIYAETTFDVKSYLAANDVSAVVAKQIAEKIKPMMQEVYSAYHKKDEDLIEGYSTFTKGHLRKFLEFLQNLVSATSAHTETKKARKPRKIKAKPASVIAAKVKYKKEDPILKLTSVEPAKIVGSTEVWVFNTKYRKMFTYVAIDGGSLSFRGNVITGFDVVTSGGKTIRKPEKFLTSTSAMTRKALRKEFDKVKSMLVKATGRMSEDIVIWKVF